MVAESRAIAAAMREAWYAQKVAAYGRSVSRDSRAVHLSTRGDE